MTRPGRRHGRRSLRSVLPDRHQTESGDWTGELTALNADRTGGDLTPISGLEGVPEGSRLAAPADWGGPLGVAVAARCGALVEPAPACLPRWMMRSGWTWSGGC